MRSAFPSQEERKAFLLKGGQAVFLDGILSACYRQGKRASKLPPEKQAELEASLREKLEAEREEELRSLNIRGACLTKEREELLQRLSDLSQGHTFAGHLQSYYYSLLYLLSLIPCLFAEFALMTWTLSPFASPAEAVLIASVATFAGMLAFELFLNLIHQQKRELESKIKLQAVYASIVFLIASALLFAAVRGFLLRMPSSEDPNQIVASSNKFYESTSFFPYALALLSLSLCIVMGVVLREGFSRFIFSGPVVRLAKRIGRLDHDIAHTRISIERINSLVAKGISEFRRGLAEGKRSNDSLFLSPLFIVLLSLVLVLIITAVARGEDSFFILFDLSSSTNCSDYEGKDEFKKNFDFVPEIIKRLEPGDEIEVIAITEKSFEKPFVILTASLPREKGKFGEKLAQAKLSLIENWSKADLKPTAKATDIFGALSLVSFMADSEKPAKIVLLSDMRNSVGVNIESPLLINPSLIEEVEKNRLIPNLKGSEVWALGVSTCGKNPSYFSSLKAFWERYFEKAGAFLRAFSAERKVLF
jgi:hypothetical protein